MSLRGGSGDDGELWADVLAGDGSAFGRLFVLHRDRVFLYCYRLTADPAEAEDITAMVFLEAWRLRHKVRVVDGSVIGWLLVTAYNVGRNQRRARVRHQRLLDRLPGAAVEPDFSDDVAARLDDTTRAQEVNRAFQTLKRRDQEVLSLCVLETVPLAQVAQLLRIPVGTVKSRLHRAKKEMSKALKLSAGWSNLEVREGES